MMILASPAQKLLIDGLRHCDECKHPKAEAFLELEFLACKRCGVTFVDGRVIIESRVLASGDPPGMEHVSSYAGELAEDVAEGLVHRALSRLPL